jgi:hypothetical protein
VIVCVLCKIDPADEGGIVCAECKQAQRAAKPRRDRKTERVNTILAVQ